MLLELLRRKSMRFSKTNYNTKLPLLCAPYNIRKIKFIGQALALSKYKTKTKTLAIIKNCLWLQGVEFYHVHHWYLENDKQCDIGYISLHFIVVGTTQNFYISEKTH